MSFSESSFQKSDDGALLANIKTALNSFAALFEHIKAMSTSAFSSDKLITAMF